MLFSVTDEFQEGRAVLLTGATGFVGSLVMEQLLRCTHAKVYVLIRGKRGASPIERLQRLLKGPLFEKAVKAGAASRVVPIEGDIQAPGMGMGADDLELMRHEVHFLIHAAADVALDRPLQTSLRCNYCSTAAVLDVAHSMQRLRSFVYVSSAFVNLNMAKGSVVEERLYDLPGCIMQSGCTHQNGRYPDGMQCTAPGDGQAASLTSGPWIAEQLLALPHTQAEAEGKQLLAAWGFPNAYTLSKHLAEKLVAQQYAQHGLPCVSVRPSLVTSAALAPHAGYLGNWAGLGVWVLAHLVGLFNCLWSIGWAADGVVDIVPGDFCASAILAAAAASSAGTAEEINPASGREPLIIHSATSGCHRLPTSLVWDSMVAFNDTHVAPFCMRAGRLPVSVNFPNYKPHLGLLALACWFTKVKVIIVCAVLRVLGQRHAATRLKMMYEGWMVVNDPAVDKDLTFSTTNLAKLQQAMDPQEQDMLPLVFDSSAMSWAVYLPTCFNAVFRKAGFAKRS